MTVLMPPPFGGGALTEVQLVLIVGSELERERGGWDVDGAPRDAQRAGVAEAGTVVFGALAEQSIGKPARRSRGPDLA